MPKVSIVIPTYNVESYLRECLDSVVNQTLKDIEIICVNDGSTDNSLQIIQEYAAKDERIKVIDKPNSGYGHSMNVGIDNATGEYLGIVEPDDYIEWNMCETLYNKAKENNLDFVKGNYFKYSTTGNISNEIFSTFDKNNIYDKLIKPSEHKETFIGGASIWSAIYKLDMLKDNNIRFLETPGASFQDTSFWINVLFATQKAMFVKDAFYHYRIDNANSSVKSNSKIFCICDELHSLEKRYSAENDKMKIINALKIDKYTWNYNRLNLQGQEEFRPTYVKEVQTIFENNMYEKKIVTSYAENVCKGILEEAARPKVSVIIPVYNAENYLKECIDSVINQTFQDLEIICVDDCSTDNSLKILKEYAVQDNRLKVIALEQNIKQGGARNRALDIAKGKYIMFVDSDDYLALDAVEKFYYAMIKNDVDVVIGSLNNFNTDKNTEGLFLEMKRYANATKKDEGKYDISQNFNGYRVGPVAKLYKKALIEQYNIRFPERIIQEDEAFHWCYFSVANFLYFIDGVYYNRRIHSNSTMYKRDSENLGAIDMIDSLEYIYLFLNKNKLYEKNKENYKQYFVTHARLVLNRANSAQHKMAVKKLKKIERKYKLNTHLFNTALENIFSIKNKDIHKIITIFGVKIKLKNKKLIEKNYHIMQEIAEKQKEKIAQLTKALSIRSQNDLEFRTFQQLTSTIRKNLYKLPSDIDVVVGIPRSGIIPAYIIALFLNKNVCSINEFVNNLLPQKGERAINENQQKEKRKILIVDDSINTGKALSKVKEQLKSIDQSKYDIEYCCIYAIEESKNKVDYYFEIVEQPRMFQWNYLNHSNSSVSCYDMDGVLCVDPTDEENDDGEKYINFILNAKPLYIPTYTINSIVTSRLEKYRAQTEEWLKQHNVKYQNLYMLDLPTAEERRKLNCHADFKAKIFSSLQNCKYFIESNRNQAIKIAELTGKQCICVETDEYFGG